MECVWVCERETRARNTGGFAPKCIDINECYMRSRRCMEPMNAKDYAMWNAIKRLAGAR